MAMKHIKDQTVVESYVSYGTDRNWRMYPLGEAGVGRWFNGGGHGEYPYELLEQWTGQHEKVCYRCLERASSRGLIEYGVSLRTGWLTPKGWAFYNEMHA